MKIITCASLAVAAAATCSEEVPTYRCAPEDTASSAWTLETVREVSEASLSLMGNSQDIGSGSTSTSTLTLEVSEEIAKATEEGGPLVISRSYETVTVDVEREGLEESEGMVIRDDDGSSELEGATVIFEFDEDAEDWSASFAEDSSGSEEWLEELAPRIDLASLLPGGDPPAVGDTWDIDPAHLVDLLLPGGEVVVDTPEDSGDVPDGAISITVPSAGDIKGHDELEGDLTGTFQEVVAEDEGSFARIVIKVDVSAEIDIVDLLEQAAEDRGVEESYNEAVLDRAMEGELTLLWDLKNHRAASLEGVLSGTEELVADWSIDAGGNNIEIQVSSSAEITKTIEATFAD
ncbi:MAG: hypothetical protein AAGG01_03110 [Planctomycetota bacterium]